MTKKLLICSNALAAACLLLSAQAQAITIGFSSGTNAVIRFDASTDSFQFIDGNGGRDFEITLSDGAGDSLGLFGNMSGTFTIGSIASFFGVEFASVSGLGTFSIFDGSSLLTATLAWNDIYTVGASGGINAFGTLNLTNIIYSGTNADLLALASGAGNNATSAVSFQFVPPESLTDLTTGSGVFDTSYSGTVFAEAQSVPDNSATITLLAMSLAGIQAIRRKLKLT
jgi:hypothetical protein